MSAHTFVINTPMDYSGVRVCTPPASTLIEVGKTELHAWHTDILCPVGCVGSFSTWSECSMPCGGGNQTRSFVVSAVADHGGVSVQYLSVVSRKKPQ